MNPVLPDRLETSRLVLRQPFTTDAKGLFDAYTQDADVARFMVWRPHSDLSQTQEFIEHCIQGWASGLRRPYVLAFHENESQPIGMIEARLLGHTIDIGYVLARPHWGKRLMSDAVTSPLYVCKMPIVSEPPSLRDQAAGRKHGATDVSNPAPKRTDGGGQKRSSASWLGCAHRSNGDSAE